jgi:IPT/TIG domain/PASTA domain
MAMRRLCPCVLVSLAVGVSLAIPAGAMALTTVGQLAPPGQAFPCQGVVDAWQLTVASGPGYVVPAPGLITSWSTNAMAGEDQHLTFKVFRPLGGERFLVVAHDGPKLLVPNSLNTFSTAIPVRADDILGLTPEDLSQTHHVGCGFRTGQTGDVFNSRLGNAADEETIMSASTGSEFRLNVSATVRVSPTISSIGPLSGSVTGGSTVTISGSDFAEVKSVTFGGIAAPIFPDHSEDKIEAVLPAGTTLGKVPVVVRTAIGTASGTFTYEGCGVPALRGLRLAVARQMLLGAGCSLGTVSGKRKRSRVGPVLSQNPEPGKLLAPGAPVDVRVKARRVKRPSSRH